jgi:hypothetical protein
MRRPAALVLLFLAISCELSVVNSATVSSLALKSTSKFMDSRRSLGKVNQFIRALARRTSLHSPLFITITVLVILASTTVFVFGDQENPAQFAGGFIMTVITSCLVSLVLFVRLFGKLEEKNHGAFLTVFMVAALFSTLSTSQSGNVTFASGLFLFLSLGFTIHSASRIAGD